MKLYIEDDVFERGGTELLGFFQAVWEARHAIALDEQGYGYRRWLKARSQTDQEYVTLAIESCYGALSKVVMDVAPIHTSQWEVNRISVQDAHGIVRLPYRILVENNQSDRRFLMAVANSEQRRVLATAERERRLEFVQGGGLREVKRILSDDIQNDRGRLKITFVFIDSDSLVRGRMHRDAIEVQDLCKQYQIPYHVLRRRSTENYLTKSSLEAYARKDPRKQVRRETLYQAFSRLSAHQRYQYHMKVGFRKKHHCGVFASLAPSDLDVLWHGWDRDESESIGYLFGSDVRERDLHRDGAMRELGPMMRNLVAQLA